MSQLFGHLTELAHKSNLRHEFVAEGQVIVVRLFLHVEQELNEIDENGEE